MTAITTIRVACSLVIALVVTFLLFNHHSIKSPTLQSKTSLSGHQCVIPTHVGIATGATQAEVKIINQAISYWNNTSKQRQYFFNLGTISSEVESYAFTSIQIVDQLTKQTIGGIKQVCGDSYLLINNTTGCINKVIIRISKQCTKDSGILETVVRHELGHALGLADTNDFTKLMFHNTEPTVQHPVNVSWSNLMTLESMYSGIRNAVDISNDKFKDK